MQTVYAGTTVTATLTALKVDGVVVASIVDPDTLTCTIYSAQGQEVASTSVAVGTITGDGAGNYTTHFTLSVQTGNYYLTWLSTVGGVVGKAVLNFNVRLRPV